MTALSERGQTREAEDNGGESVREDEVAAEVERRHRGVLVRDAMESRQAAQP